LPVTAPPTPAVRLTPVGPVPEVHPTPAGRAPEAGSAPEAWPIQVVAVTRIQAVGAPRVQAAPIPVRAAAPAAVRPMQREVLAVQRPRPSRSDRSPTNHPAVLVREVT